MSKAVVFDRFGDPAEVLHVVDADLREPGPGEVRVRMLASPINPSDILRVRGVHALAPSLPATPGLEGVGVVESAGPGLLGHFLVGKRVATVSPPTGAWREFTIANARQAIPVSAGLSDEQAAMFFINPTTAFLLTQRVLQPPRGAWLLQSAAASAVGKMVVRLGRRFGFRTVNLVRRAEHAAELKSLGADAVVVVEDPSTVHAQVKSAAGGAEVKYALDPVGGATGGEMIRCLGPRGRLVAYGSLAPEPTPVVAREVVNRELRIEGFQLSHFMSRLGLFSRLLVVRNVSSLTAGGVLVGPPTESRPLSDVVSAVVDAEKPGRDTKIVLRIGDR